MPCMPCVERFHQTACDSNWCSQTKPRDTTLPTVLDRQSCLLHIAYHMILPHERRNAAKWQGRKDIGMEWDCTTTVVLDLPNSQPQTASNSSNSDFLTRYNTYNRAPSSSQNFSSILLRTACRTGAGGVFFSNLRQVLELNYCNLVLGTWYLMRQQNS